MNRWTQLLSILTIAILFSGCNLGKTANKNQPSPSTSPNSQFLVNALEYPKRPFIVVVPHSTQRLLTLYLSNFDPDIKSSIVDIEYLSGDSLKGGRVTPVLPIPFDYARSFLLGSCSTGGKCSFDQDLKTGTIKTRLEFTSSQHILKSDFVFVSGTSTTSDGRLNFVPKDKKQTNLIFGYSQGLPIPFTGEPILPPIYFSSSKLENIQGRLQIKSDIPSSVKIYDGTAFKNIDFSKNSDGISLNIDNIPWQKKVEIIRDDQKGASETTVLSILGPIVLVK